ncbi:tryptophan synthase subunit alpha [Gephyromycinifex aptenodytis]|uniref:tryptophan synthase subunit alpha n=1 Tax=Gephyromycinifex aptenodytis TaxID=2716227 RepID=UPI0014461F2A|nr:tryptophan synthase subunit alpha [Gephyromycinifex aptenodytis]
MSRLSEVLSSTREQNRAALVAYLPVGFPSLDRSLEAMRAVVEAGADVVEVGLPYSDPLMDGPVIQHAAQVALAGGVRVAHVFEAVRTVVEAGAACVTMSYWNPILRYGPERFAADLAAAGGSGIITPDLIPEEAGDWLSAAQEHDLDPIFLVAPSSTDARLAMTVQHCRGFVYVASTMGVTGARAQVGSGAADLIERTRAVTDLPLCVGLGVSTGEQAAQVAAYADGVIVGSALVATLKDDEPDSGCEQLRALTAELAAGVRGGRE